MKIKTIINGTVLLGIFIGAMFFNGCQDIKKNKRDETFIKNPQKVTISDHDLEESLITYKKAIELEANYLELRYEDIHKTIGYYDHREFIFSLEKMKKYIAYIEEQTADKGFENLGLRVYLGAYAPGQILPDNSKISAKDYPKGLTTVFFIPTATNAREIEDKLQIKNLVLESQNIHREADGMNYGGGGTVKLATQ